MKEVDKSSINVNISKVSDKYTWICKNEVHDSLKGNSGEVNNNVIDSGACNVKPKWSSFISEWLAAGKATEIIVFETRQVFE